MKIGGLQPVTLLDYPHKVAAIIFTSGCNMRCHFCYNPNLVVPELINDGNFLPEEDVLAFLAQRKKYLDGVCITGGEPALQSDIVSFCQKIKDLGYAIKLDTNGLLPNVVQELIDKKLIDYIAMDIKGPIDKYEKYCGVTANDKNILQTINLIKDSGLDYEFRSTLVKGLHDENDVEAMAKVIAGAKRYFLQNFNEQEVLVGNKSGLMNFSGSEMTDFCKLAEKYVKMCQVR